MLGLNFERTLALTDPTITCPNCKHQMPLTESLAAPLLAETRRQFEAVAAEKDRVIAGREAALRAQAGALEKDRTALEATIAEKLAAERARIAGEEAAKAAQRAAADLDVQARKLAEAQGLLRENEAKLADAQKAQADFLRQKRQLDDARREMDLTIEKQVQDALGVVREKAKQEAEEGLKLRVAEREQQIASMQRQIEDLKRKAEQGSQQSQGEALELELENFLRTKFPLDVFEPVPKGEFGADLIQKVAGVSGSACGAIIWEMKRTKNFGGDWIAKLKGDQRRCNADVAILVSTALHKDVRAFDFIDGVWVTDFRYAGPLALALRQSLIDVAMARIAGEGQQTKMELVYDYLTGPRFRQRVEAIVEKFEEMQSDLAKEKKAMMKSWAKRDAQIASVLDSTAGMYGDLQGIAGKALKEISSFEFPAVEDKRDESDKPDKPVAAE